MLFIAESSENIKVDEVDGKPSGPTQQESTADLSSAVDDSNEKDTAPAAGLLTSAVFI